MQEANDKTQLKPKKSTKPINPGQQYFFPPLGIAGIASALPFFLKAIEEQDPKIKMISDNEIELDNIGIHANATFK